MSAISSVSLERLADQIVRRLCIILGRIHHGDKRIFLFHNDTPIYCKKYERLFQFSGSAPEKQ